VTISESALVICGAPPVSQLFRSTKGVALVSIGLSLVWLAMRSASDWRLPFIGPKSFQELGGFTKDEQKRLIHEASKAASKQMRSFVPVIVFAALFSCGAAVGQTLPKVTTVPDSFWVHAAFACLFAAIGGWLAARLEVGYVRPFLRACIERTSHAG